MTKREWILLLCALAITSACLGLIITHNSEKDLFQNNDEQENSLKHAQRELVIRRHADKLQDDSFNVILPVLPDKDLEYYDEHFDDYHDDPEDGITYPDEIFDFLDD